jgi:ABC-type multidrug transport system fused ATPase/permease subunit
MDSRDARIIIYGIVGVVIFAFMLRFMMAFRFVLFAVLIVAGVPAGIYFLWKYLTNRKKERAYKASTEGRIATRLEECQLLLKENKEEIKDIRANIRELQEEQKKYDQKMATRNWKDLQELIGGFKAELELRDSKALFFQRCIQKLDQMLANHRLAKALEEKKDKLQSLQDEHFEGLAKLEELKSDVEMDVFYLDTIESLSQRMLASSTVDDALQLKKELEEMTRELE